MDMLPETLAGVQATEAVREAFKVLLVQLTTDSSEMDMMVEHQIHNHILGLYHLLREHQYIVPHGTGLGYPRNHHQRISLGEVKVGREKASPTEETLEHFRPEQGL